MVKIFSDYINEDIMNTAHSISLTQKEDVLILTPTETLEVVYEKVSETQEVEKETHKSETTYQQETS